MAARKSAAKSKARPRPDPLQTVTAFLTRSEVGGIALLVLAVITLLSLLTRSNGVLTGALINTLSTLFGVGIWGFPVVTGALGFWMIIRAIERLPNLPWQRPAGLALLFAAGLIGATLWLRPQQQAGGGEVGLLLTSMLENVAGVGAAWAFFAFLGVAGLLLLTDRWLINAGQDFWYLVQEWQQQRALQPSDAIRPALPLPTGIIPLLKQLRERWQWSATTQPVANTVQPVPQPNLVSPDPPVRQAQRTSDTPRPAAARNAPAAPLASEPANITPHIIGGNTAQEWRLPRLPDILKDWERRSDSDDLIRQQGRLIQETLELFGVPADFEGAYKGPSVTQYLIKPGYIERTVAGELKRVKIKVSKIAGLSNDLALALAAPSVRIEAPIPGTNYVGIEVPNQEGNTVGLKELMESDIFQNMKGKLRIALGEDVKGQPIVSDMTRMPHLLIAGATGSGKSACINSIISCLLLTNTPDNLRFLMVDPKMVELTLYNGIPHLLSPVVTEVDKAAGVLFWAVKEMERRYTLCSKVGARDLVRYNEYLAKRNEKALPYIVVIVDEMADLMMAAPEEVEKHICRLAQMARAVGIHLIIATQRPSVDVITGLIKANFPSRIAFAVTSQTDSRVILDVPGADRLLGRGDMLFMAPDSGKLERLQGTWVSDDEISKVVRYWKGIRSLDVPSSGALPLDAAPFVDDPASSTTPAMFGNQGSRPAQSSNRASLPSTLPATGLSQPPLFEEIEAMQAIAARDELFESAVRIVQEAGRGSVSLLQRKLRIGYSRSARLIDQLEEAGIIGPDLSNGQGREVLVGGAQPTQGENNTTPANRPSSPNRAPDTSKAPRIIGEDDEQANPPRVWM